MAILVQSNKKPSVTFPSQTGGIVTFNSQFEGLPLKSCKVAIPVTQEGSGDPSPENVRNFVGVDSLDFSATGKNLFNIDSLIENKGLDVDTGEEISQSSTKITPFIPVGAGSYYWNGNATRPYFYDSNKVFIERGNYLISADTFTVGSGVGYVRFQASNANWNIENLQLEKGTEGTAFEAFGNNKLFTFGQTIYAGELDVLTGIFTATHGAVDLGSLTWSYNSQYDRYESNGISNIYPRGARRLEFNCEVYQVISDGRPLANVPDLSIYTGYTDNLTYLYIHDSTFAGDASALTNYLAGKYVVIPLRNSITTPLGGMDISTLQGENNLFASTGETTAQHIKIGG